MNSENDVPKNQKKDDVHPHRYRRFIAQFLATSVKNFHMLDAGLIMGLPAIVIPALTGIRNKHNQDEPLTIDGPQVSWLVAVATIFQPLGCLLSAPLTEPLGRKLAMILVNIPFAIGWFLMYQASAVWHVFVGVAVLGFSTSLLEAPVVTYLGEICEPSYRGILVSYSVIYTTVGVFLIYFANTMMAWRTVCLACLSVPVMASIAICFVIYYAYYIQQFCY